MGKKDNRDLLLLALIPLYVIFSILVWCLLLTSCRTIDKTALEEHTTRNEEVDSNATESKTESLGGGLSQTDWMKHIIESVVADMTFEEEEYDTNVTDADGKHPVAKKRKANISSKIMTEREESGCAIDTSYWAECQELDEIKVHGTTHEQTDKQSKEVHKDNPWWFQWIGMVTLLVLIAIYSIWTKHKKK